MTATAKHDLKKSETDKYILRETIIQYLIFGLQPISFN